MGCSTCCTTYCDKDDPKSVNRSMMISQNQSLMRLSYTNMDQIMIRADQMSPWETYQLVKFQAHVRGMITRNKLRTSPVFAKLYKNQKKAGGKGNKYYSLQVFELRKQIGEFSYGNRPGQVDVQLELRPEQILPSNKAKYEGQWIVGTQIRAGKGKQVWPDGSFYEGWWKDNKANGRGRLIHTNGEMYEGVWYNDMAHGHGIYLHLDGSRYEGNWTENEQHGLGVETWPDGAEYNGQYSHGKKQGKGRFTWTDGSMYYGDFDDNIIQGQGTYTWKDGRKFIGTWLNKKMEGTGTFTWPDGRKYYGEYKNDKKDGYGVFNWPDGRKYEGSWLNGKQHGNGTYTSASGKSKQGYWENGKRIKWLKEDDPNEPTDQTMNILSDQSRIQNDVI